MSMVRDNYVWRGIFFQKYYYIIVEIFLLTNVCGMDVILYLAVPIQLFHYTQVLI
jgi:hypothetical protein